MILTSATLDSAYRVKTGYGKDTSDGIAGTGAQTDINTENRISFATKETSHGAGPYKIKTEGRLYL